MAPVWRGLIMYAFLLVVFRITGRRALSETTTFDLVLLLIISEATQQAMIGDDFSITNAVLVVTTLLFADILLSLWKRRSPRVDRWVEGVPIILVEDGRPLRELMNKSRVDEQDILQAARDKQGLGRMDDIKYAILERSGGITIIPKD